MNTDIVLFEVPGGRALFDWFGDVPHFHDARLLEINLSTIHPCVLRVHAWRTSDSVDTEGNFLTEKHAAIVMTLEGVRNVSLNDFGMCPAIIFNLDIARTDTGFAIAWTSSYGVDGSVEAERMDIALRPGKP